MESDFIFDEDRRKKAVSANILLEILIENLKAKDGYIKDGKYLQSFYDGMLAGLAVGAGAINITIEHTRINESTGDIILGIRSDLLNGLKLLKEQVETYT